MVNLGLEYCHKGEIRLNLGSENLLLRFLLAVAARYQKATTRKKLSTPNILHVVLHKCLGVIIQSVNKQLRLRNTHQTLNGSMFETPLFGNHGNLAHRPI
jgi:hypothetical protein